MDVFPDSFRKGDIKVLKVIKAIKAIKVIKAIKAIKVCTQLLLSELTM
jgi:hypothetical protein